MEFVLGSLSKALFSSAIIAILAAFSWGVLSVILSPCHLVSIPLIVGFISQRNKHSTISAFRISLLFAIGILITIAVIGLITAFMGRLIGDIGSWSNYLVAAVFFFVGLHLRGNFEWPWPSKNIKDVVNPGYMAILGIGLIFGLSLGPCTFAYMAPVLGIVFGLSKSQPIFSLALLAAFAIGHCLVILMAGMLTDRVQRYLEWAKKTQQVAVIRKASGNLVMLGALYLVYLALQ